eukprot:6206848-Pleurochrysis_carterae.AAC.1
MRRASRKKSQRKRIVQLCWINACLLNTLLNGVRALVLRTLASIAVCAPARVARRARSSYDTSASDDWPPLRATIDPAVRKFEGEASGEPLAPAP